MITAQLVKELRERTGISMMDCKNALSETNGDVDAAIEVLRKKSVLKAEKKADRATNEGALVVGVAETFGFIVEVNTETCLLYTSPSPRDATLSRMPSSA